MRVEYSIAVERWSDGCESGGVNTTQKLSGTASLPGRCDECTSLRSWKACRFVITTQSVDSKGCLQVLDMLFWWGGFFQNILKYLQKLPGEVLKKSWLFWLILFCFWKKVGSLIVETFFNFFYKTCKKNFRWGCVFCSFQNYIENLLNYGENDIEKMIVFFGDTS